MTIPQPRFVTNFKVAGTKSFRLAASKFLGEYCGNAQNPPACVMELFEARPGHKFVQPDQSGAEALVVANLAPRGKYLELFEAGIKPHTFLAMHLFAESHPEWFEGIQPREVYFAAPTAKDLSTLEGYWKLDSKIKKSGAPYALGKMTVHASSYCMGWKTFIGNALLQSSGALVLTAAQSKAFLAMFHALYPEISVWQQETIFLAGRNRELVNLLNYPRRFERNLTQSYTREIVSWIPQSTVGCITTLAILNCDEYIKSSGKRWNILNNKHDSLLLEVPEADVAEAAAYSVKAIKSIDLTGRHGVFNMKSEIKVGDNWGDYHEKYNPKGMKEYII